MSFPLPPHSHPAREAMGDIAHLVEVLAPANVGKLPCFREAVAKARRQIAETPAVRAINIVCLRADDERWLVRVGRRGGWKRLWNFGTGRPRGA